MSQQGKVRFFSVIVFLFAIFAGFFSSQFLFDRIPALPNFVKKHFVLGLDLRGGAHLLYRAETAMIQESPEDAMNSLRDAIERRVNIYGVSEPLIQIEKKGDEYRLVVELAGVTDVNQAIKLIGETPFLEFRELNGPIPKNEEETKAMRYISTGLNGRFMKKAQVAFDSTTGKPNIAIEFNDEGGGLFADITKRNIQKPVGIFLDGVLLSQPTVQQEIQGGKAEITGQFTIQEAKDLVRYLNAGALPVPITLIGRENIQASLGEVYVRKSMIAGLYGFLFVALFMIIWYRLPGIIAVIALCVYAALTLSLFKLIPVTLTTAGIAGFILSVGMAVDANILVFERMKEELKKGKTLHDSVHEGFARAWTSIRDSNVSSLITAIILYSFGTSIVKGFALTLSLGILVSMFTALTITRNFLLSILTPRLEKYRSLFLSGIKNG
ncbi:MAG: protein translocase subunit SecD [Patescibacteria group bacterium]